MNISRNRCFLRQTRLVVTSFAFFAVISAAGSAQNQAPQPAGPNTLVGIVTDTAGIPLQDVDVLIVVLQRSTRTRADGSFRFDSIPVGSYDVRPRRIGFIGATPTVKVASNGGTVLIKLIRFGQALPSVVTVAALGGLSGVIGDTVFRALPNVLVTAIGAAQTTKSDSAGAFFMPLKPGRYLIRLDLNGYERQTVGVTLPDSAGRRIAAWLAPRKGPANHLEANLLFELGQRVVRVSPASSKFLTREDLEQQGVVDLQALALRWGNGRLTGECTVALGGTTVSVPISQLTTPDIEFVELYLPSKIGSVRGGTSINGQETKFITSTTMQPAAKAACANLALIVWLRK